VHSLSRYSEIFDPLQTPSMPIAIRQVVRKLLYLEPRKIFRNFT